jgi:outer membrane protein OmpA-like peptidoglycan-associated protein
MNRTNFPRFVLIASLIGFYSIMFAQKNKEAVILINTSPVLAEISADANIVKVISEQPDYMKGFVLSGYVVPEEIKSILEIPQFQPYKVVSTDKLTVYFSDGFATLSNSAIEVLDLIVLELNNNPERKVMVTVYEDNLNSVLTKNRVNAIKSFLRVENISLDRVVTNTVMGLAPSNQLDINYLD